MRKKKTEEPVKKTTTSKNAAKEEKPKRKYKPRAKKKTEEPVEVKPDISLLANNRLTGNAEPVTSNEYSLSNTRLFGSNDIDITGGINPVNLSVKL